MPKTQGPGDNRNEVLNPTMERCSSARNCRQMGRGRVEENTDEYVNYDQKTSCAKKSPKKFHFGSHPLGGVCALSVASAISGGQGAGDPALAVTSYLAHTPTDIIDPLITTQTSVTVHGSSRLAIRQA